jgi:hypothetical protein
MRVIRGHPVQHVVDHVTIFSHFASFLQLEQLRNDAFGVAFVFLPAGRVAEWITRQPPELKVLGSIPSVVAKFFSVFAFCSAPVCTGSLRRRRQARRISCGQLKGEKKINT